MLVIANFPRSVVMDTFERQNSESFAFRGKYSSACIIMFLKAKMIEMKKMLERMRLTEVFQ